jgi:hypothetical protein
MMRAVLAIAVFALVATSASAQLRVPPIVQRVIPGTRQPAPVLVGIDALLVLRDIRGLDRDETEAVSRWAARALLRASLEETA